jgi:hypothetical protein
MLLTPRFSDASIQDVEMGTLNGPSDPRCAAYSPEVRVGDSSRHAAPWAEQRWPGSLAPVPPVTKMN